MTTIKSIKVGEITYDLKATYDGSGNNIAETYAKSSTIPTKVSLLDNDENYLTEHLDISGLATKELVEKKVDKELGKGLSEANYTETEKQKLSGIATNANNYTHPSKHPASIITESDTKRFVSDVEKDSWNNKLGKSEEEAISFALNELNNKIEDILKYIKQLNIMIEKNI